jgi:hypothetical protein
MCADGCVDGFVLFAEFDGALQGATMRVTGADVEDHRDARRMRAPDHIFAIGVEFVTIDVSV